MANEWDKMQTTLCWRCPTVYRMVDSECPHCHAANANVDIDKVRAEAAADRKRELENA